jgi:hypothetical protein
MTNLRKFIALVGLAGLCSVPNLRAEIASGSFTNNFANGVRIWDISGNYNGSLDNLGLNYTINMDKSGKFSGGGAFAMPGFTNATLTFLGSLKNVSSNVTRVNISLKLKGTMLLGEEGPVYIRAAVNEKLEIDDTSRTMVGTMSGSASVSIPFLHRSASQRIPITDVQLSLPPGMTGNWQLALNVQTNGTHYTGDGEVTLSNGRTIPVVASGSYGAKTDISKLLVKSAGTSNGIVRLGLTSTVVGGQMNVQRLIGMALGQNLRSVTP